MHFEEFFESLNGAFAPNTIRAYESDYRHYAAWCNANQYDANQIDGETFANYVLEMGKSLKTATILRRVASLSSVFRLMKLKDPTQEPEVILALKRLHRKLGRAQQQATPLTKDLLEKLIAVCDDDLIGLRNKVLLRLGYETMRRRAELCAFEFSDIKHMPKARYAINLRSSKTDQYGEGKLLPISDTLVELINDWKHKANLEHGRILRGFFKSKSIRDKLNPSSINNILKQLQAKAHLNDIGEMSGHSFRVGGAIDMLSKGIPLERIMLRGGWKSDTTAMRYLRNWQEEYWL